MTVEVADVINTFRMLAELPPDSLGAYVISMARSASDVLAVVLLQRECGVKVRGLPPQLPPPNPLAVLRSISEPPKNVESSA